jgi:hypothetical protein
VGLIAREIERRGVPTLSMSSAYSITAAVKPPRAAFLDFPLGHTAGKPGDAAGNRAILRAALGAFETLREPGGIVRLPFEWRTDDAWKDSVMRPRVPGAGHARAAGQADDRVERHATPQYQCEADRVLAEAAPSCETCVFLDA